MTKSEFARYCGCSPTTITRGINDGKISTNFNGLIDAYSKKNARFCKIQKERKARTAAGRSQSTPYAERNPENRANPKRIDGKDDNRKNCDLGQNAQQSEDLSASNENSNGSQYNYFDDDRTEIDYAIEKMRSATALNKAKLAEMVRATVRRDFVDQVISLIGTAINDHFITMGDRMADGLAAIAGSSDPSIIRKIKEEIDDDVTSSLQEMKRVIEQRYHERLRS
jgi:hypothetical protein